LDQRQYQRKILWRHSREAGLIRSKYPTGDYLSSLTTGLTNGDITVGVEYWDTTAG